MKRAGYLAAASRYLPLDELLEMPRVRVLRALRRFDWMSVREMLDALNEHEPRVNIALWRALAVLVDAGHAEKAPNGRGHIYRITAGGRRELERLLDRAVISEARAS
jgi:DNA-binding MarR family transcriptional regulator